MPLSLITWHEHKKVISGLRGSLFSGYVGHVHDQPVYVLVGHSCLHCSCYSSPPSLDLKGREEWRTGVSDEPRVLQSGSQAGSGTHPDFQTNASGWLERSFGEIGNVVSRLPGGTLHSCPRLMLQASTSLFLFPSSFSNSGKVVQPAASQSRGWQLVPGGLGPALGMSSPQMAGQRVIGPF